jgi:hypothetical protein
MEEPINVLLSLSLSLSLADSVPPPLKYIYGISPLTLITIALVTLPSTNLQTNQ